MTAVYKFYPEYPVKWDRCNGTPLEWIQC